MAIQVEAVTIDCGDPEKLARFWASVLDYQVTDTGENSNGTRYIEIGPGDRADRRAWTLLFEEIPDGAPKAGKNRLHIDLAPKPGQYRDEVGRVLSLGGTRADIGQGDEVPWTVLADPGRGAVDGARRPGGQRVLRAQP